MAKIVFISLLYFLIIGGAYTAKAQDSTALPDIGDSLPLIVTDSITETNIDTVAEVITPTITTTPPEPTITEQIKPRTQNNLTFFLLLALVTFPAIFKYLFPIQFYSLFAIFKNPLLSTRNLKEHINQNSQVSSLFYLFYSYSTTLFLYFAFFYNFKEKDTHISGTTILTLFAIISLAFILKYSFLKLTGWAFNIREQSENYLFHTLVFNRIISLIVIPFTIFLAIGYSKWHTFILIIACIVICALLINRYFKSGSIWSYFLKYGKLHFFLYLCASEILPIAILVKLITTWQ